MSHCPHMKLDAGLSRVHAEKSKVIGLSLLIVVNGHAPSLSKQQMELTSGWFGCWTRRDLNC